jgi:hypothetical protein
VFVTAEFTCVRLISQFGRFVLELTSALIPNDTNMDGFVVEISL